MGHKVLGEGNRQPQPSPQKQPSKSGARADRDRHDRSERGEWDSTGRPLSDRGDRPKRTDGRPLSDRGDRPKRTEGHQRPLLSPRIPEQRCEAYPTRTFAVKRSSSLTSPHSATSLIECKNRRHEPDLVDYHDVGLQAQSRGQATGGTIIPQRERAFPNQ
jgi:hypothetical protein